jgi:hypothetical protein
MAPASAQALPFYGYNAVQTPCVDPPYYQTSATPSGPSSNCMNSTRFNWMNGKQSTYRMRVDKNVVDTYGWAPLDTAIQRQKAAGGDVAAVLSQGPAGVSGAVGAWQLPISETDLMRWYAFVREAVVHLAAQGVAEFEIWNEPNTHYAYNGVGVQADPAQYAAVYCRAYDAFRQVGQPGRLTWGGIYNHRQNKNKSFSNPPPVDPPTGYMFNNWIPAVKMHMVSKCGTPRTDGVAFHPYASAETYVNDNTYGYAMQVWLGEFRQVMNESSLQGAYIMANENGWPAVYPGDLGGPEDDQKQKLIRYFNACASMKDTHYIRGCYWYPLQDGARCDPSMTDAAKKLWIHNCAGLVTSSAQPRAAFWTFLGYLPPR